MDVLAVGLSHDCEPPCGLNSGDVAWQILTRICANAAIVDIRNKKVGVETGWGY